MSSWLTMSMTLVRSTYNHATAWRCHGECKGQHVFMTLGLISRPWRHHYDCWSMTLVTSCFICMTRHPDQWRHPYKIIGLTKTAKWELFFSAYLISNLIVLISWLLLKRPATSKEKSIFSCAISSAVVCCRGKGEKKTAIIFSWLREGRLFCEFLLCQSKTGGGGQFFNKGSN